MERWSAVVQLMQDKNLTLTSAESFTGGLFADRLTNLPGASKVYVGGFVCYSEEFKIKHVGVPAKIIKKFGVVSRECAEAMALGAVKATGAHVGVAFTGYAGNSGSADTPNGHAYVSIAFLGRVDTWEINEPRLSREAFKLHAVDFVGNELIKLVKNAS